MISEISKTWSFFLKIKSALYKIFLEKIVTAKYSKKNKRFLEIGPGENRIEGFETINIIKNKNTDYIGDATKRLDFSDNTFDVIYASHILEHTPWYKLEDTINEWARVIKPGGSLEIWVPDSLKIAKAFYEAEAGIGDDFLKDGWFRFNEERDPAKWFSGRIFSYGDGQGTRGHFNFHLSAFSERYLKKLFVGAGFINIVKMEKKECRGDDHGWINLGVKGIKK